jgi:hypothetical protein
MIAMNKESIFYKVYDFVRENRAVTREEIKLKFNMPNNVVTRYISMLIEQGLLFQGDFIQSKNKKCARIKVVGLTEQDVKRKEQEYLSDINEESLQVNLFSKMLDFLKGMNKAVIPSEALLEIQKEQPQYSNLDYVATVLRDLWKRGLILRSPFNVPPDCLTGWKAKRGSFIYGLTEEQIKDKVISLAPKEVRDAYFRVMNEAKVFASFHLKKLTGISIVEEDCDFGVPKLRQWFIMRFVKAGWLNYELYKQTGYFWRKSLPIELAYSQIRELHPKSIAYRLECQNLGRLSERRALWTFVTWAKLVWNLNIEIPSRFPYNVPSWFHKKNIEKYKGTQKLPTGREIETLTCGIWKFDLNPLDFIAFTSKDLFLNSRYCGFALNCKFIGKRIGLSFLRNMVLALRDGEVQRYHKDKEGKKRPVDKSIPLGGFLTPVIFCKQVAGSGIFWKKVKDYGAIVITQSKIEKMEEELKIRFNLELPESEKINAMMEKMRLYETYQKNALATGADPVKMVLEAVK